MGPLNPAVRRRSVAQMCTRQPRTGPSDNVAKAMSSPARSEKTLTLLAFTATYLGWGSCFLGIRYAVETIPPLLMLALRFGTAGLILGTVLWSLGKLQFGKRDVFEAFIQAMLLLVVSNGASAWAASFIPSSFSALLWATIPLWTVLLTFVWRGEQRPSRRVLFSAGVSFLGLVVLIQPWNTDAKLETLVPTLLVLMSAGCWSVSSFLSKRSRGGAAPLTSTVLQFFCGATVLAIAALFKGEVAAFDLGAVSSRSWTALAFLAVPGAIFPLSGYVWLLRRKPPALVSTYAYVNPVVAVILGSAIAHEAVGIPTLLGGGIIVLGVVLSMTDRPVPVPASAPTLTLPPMLEPLRQSLTGLAPVAAPIPLAVAAVVPSASHPTQH